jgi:cell division protein FtsL
MRSRLALLALAVVVSATLVVELRHRNRQLYAELQALNAERDALVTEWGRLLLEEGAWSQHRRIEATARARLGMDLPDAQAIVVVPLAAAGARP